MVERALSQTKCLRGLAHFVTLYFKSAYFQALSTWVDRVSLHRPTVQFETYLGLKVEE